MHPSLDWTGNTDSRSFLCPQRYREVGRFFLGIRLHPTKTMEHCGGGGNGGTEFVGNFDSDKILCSILPVLQLSRDRPRLKAVDVLHLCEKPPERELCWNNYSGSGRMYHVLLPIAAQRRRTVESLHNMIVCKESCNTYPLLLGWPRCWRKRRATNALPCVLHSNFEQAECMLFVPRCDTTYVVLLRILRGICPTAIWAGGGGARNGTNIQGWLRVMESVSTKFVFWGACQTNCGTL